MEKIKKIKMLGLGLTAFSLFGMNALAEPGCTTLQCEIDNALDGGTVKLAKDYTESVTFPAGKSITLDLNGWILTTEGVAVRGDVTVVDSRTNGQIVSNDTAGNNPLASVYGTLTIDGGIFKNENGNGIYLSGGTVTLNDGSIITKYSGLASSSTSNFVTVRVKGGTITTNSGASIYLAGPSNLEMTSGTLNGGIALRMGTVNISGGTINAGSGGVNLAEHYDKTTTNLPLYDALYVLGGTMNTDVSGQTNKLEVNISGGNFNVTNGKGSAVAFYDLAKVAQTSSITISGTPRFITNATNRDAYQVLTLADLGVTSPTGGFDNTSYKGQLATSISGGTYSSTVKDEYLADGYMVEVDGDVYNVVEDTGDNTVQIEVPTISDSGTPSQVMVGVTNQNEIGQALVNALQATSIRAKHMKIKVSINNKEESAVDTDVLNSMKTALTASQSTAKMAQYMDISLDVIDRDTGEIIGNLTAIDTRIKFKVAIPESLKNTDSKITRTYYIVRYHDGASDVIDASMNEDGTLSFESDKFSTYALAYRDVSDTENPPTLDTISSYIFCGIVALVGILVGGAYLKKQNR